MHSSALCSAQTTVSPLKMLIFTTLEGILCSGEFRIHNPKVGGSIPPPATNNLNKFKDLGQNRKIELARVVVKLPVVFLKNVASYYSNDSKILRFSRIPCARLAVLGGTNPMVIL